MAVKKLNKEFPLDLKENSSVPISKDYLDHLSNVVKSTVETEDKKLLKCKVTHLNIIDYLVWTCRWVDTNGTDSDSNDLFTDKKVTPVLKNVSDDTIAVYKVTISNSFIREMFKFSHKSSSNCGATSLVNSNIGNKHFTDLIFSVREFFKSNLVTYEEYEENERYSRVTEFLVCGLRINLVNPSLGDIIANIESIDFSVNMNVVRKLFLLNEGGYGYTNMIDLWCLSNPITWLLYKMVTKDLKYISKDEGKLYTIEYITHSLGLDNRIANGDYIISNIYRDLDRALEEINEDTNFVHANGGELIMKKHSKISSSSHKYTHINFSIKSEV